MLIVNTSCGHTGTTTRTRGTLNAVVSKTAGELLQECIDKNDISAFKVTRTAGNNYLVQERMPDDNVHRHGVTGAIGPGGATSASPPDRVICGQLSELGSRAGGFHV